ncbi:MAG: hypothetical protein JWR74_1137 [Polaromonas sp.]|nr:hypothetical protein [Polaromonas sp.]
MKKAFTPTGLRSKSAALSLVFVTGAAVLMAGCAGVKPPPKEYAQEQLDTQVQVPPGHVVALETTAVGILNYECKANPAMGGNIGWVLASPQADLMDRTGKVVGKYSGPPATWTHMDGSSVVGMQVAIAPRPGASNLPFQLSKGTPGAASGAMQNITYIQRVKTKGGLELTKACTQTDVGDKQTLPYQADYIFWKAA